MTIDLTIDSTSNASLAAEVAQLRDASLQSDHASTSAAADVAKLQDLVASLNAELSEQKNNLAIQSEAEAALQVQVNSLR